MHGCTRRGNVTMCAADAHLTAVSTVGARHWNPGTQTVTYRDPPPPPSISVTSSRRVVSPLTLSVRVTNWSVNRRIRITLACGRCLGLWGIQNRRDVDPRKKKELSAILFAFSRPIRDLSSQKKGGRKKDKGTKRAIQRWKGEREKTTKCVRGTRST